MTIASEEDKKTASNGTGADDIFNKWGDPVACIDRCWPLDKAGYGRGGFAFVTLNIRTGGEKCVMFV